MKFLRHRFVIGCLGLMAGWLAVAARADEPVTFTTLGNIDMYSEASLTLGSDGSFYGTTLFGGTNGVGSVFRVTTNGVFTTLASMSLVNGGQPYGAPALGDDGNLYCTAAIYGTNGGGTIFQVTTNGDLTVLDALSYTTVDYPLAGLTLGKDGSFYGPANMGGTNGSGAVFRATTNGALTTLVSFGPEQSSPYGGLCLGTDGNLYGTTVTGGTNGLGTVFRVTTNGQFAVLAAFDGTNGANPYAAMVQGRDGNLYGTTPEGGVYGFGTVFRATTNGGNGCLKAVTSFDYTNGEDPQSLVQGIDGDLYGTAAVGGVNGFGTIFRVSTNEHQIFSTGLNLIALVSFDFATMGAYPYSGLTLGTDGKFYGLTSTSTNIVDGFPNGTFFSVYIPPDFHLVNTFNPVILNGQFRFGFTNLLPGAAYNVISATNPAIPMVDWTGGTVFSNVPGGYYQFVIR